VSSQVRDFRGFAGSRLQSFPGSRLRSFAGPRFQIFTGSRLQSFAGPRFQIFTDSPLRSFAGSRFQIFIDSTSLKTYFMNFVKLDVPRCNTLKFHHQINISNKVF
jgi:hypothetical protein